MLLLLLASSLSAATFSGVTPDNLMDTPNLKRVPIVELSGEKLVAAATGLALEDREGLPIGLTEEGFTLTMKPDLAMGDYVLGVTASAPNRGTDSFWLSVDGKQLKDPFSLPVNSLRDAYMAFSVEEPGPHELTLELREAPGCLLQKAGVYRSEMQAPVPAMRPELVGQHPRLLLAAADIEGLRARAESDVGKRYYSLPGVYGAKPPEYRPGSRNGGAYRGLGNHAFAYLLDPRPERLVAILDWLQMATKYDSVGVDLDAEYFMEGLAFTYDYLYDQIPTDLRDRVRAVMVRQCRELYNASLAGRTGGGHSYQQNHYWFAHLALAMGAAALYGEVPEAEQWLPWAWDRFERIAITFGPDGGFHEGPGYWDYSMPTLYLYTDLYEWCTGQRVPAADQGLAGQAEFRLHHMYPGLKLCAALEDTATEATLPPTRVLLWEASRYHNTVTQGIAALLSRGASSDRFNLLCLDETLQEQEARDGTPPARHYPDVENVFCRTSWDEEATYLAFVCRPLGGHVYADLCARYSLGGTGHNHPAQGHFVLFGLGEVLAADPGYTYEKKTRNHNTILVNGEGQLGDGQMWPVPNDGRAHITGFVTSGDTTITRGDATSAYPEELGLTKFERTIVLSGPSLIVVRDRLTAKEPATFSWLCHHYGEARVDGTAFAITRGGAKLTVTPQQPSKLTVKTETYTPQYVHPTRNLTPEQAEIGLVQLDTEPTTETTFLVPMLVSEADVSPGDLEPVPAINGSAVRLEGRIVAFRDKEGEMTIETPWGQSITTRAEAVVIRQTEGDSEVVELGE